MYIFTAYIQASVLTSVRKRIRIWSRASIKAHHLLRCSRLPFFSISPGLRDTLTSFRSPRSGDPRADIWPVSQTGETNLRLRFFFISFDSWCSFCKVGWRGFDKRQKKKETHHGVSDAKRSKSLQTNKSGFSVNVAHFRTCLTEIRRLLTKKTSCVGKVKNIFCKKTPWAYVWFCNFSIEVPCMVSTVIN